MYATVGVLGGMGPEATVDLLTHLIRLTPAKRDQEHVPVIVYGDPRVPDRTDAIRGLGPSPLPSLLRGVRFLDQAGVCAIAIPCNTAHVWYEQLQRAISTPILHIADAAIARLETIAEDRLRVGILSTDGTRETGLYRERLVAADHEPVEPDDAEMLSLVSPGIAAVKAGDLGAGRTALSEAAHRLVGRGIDVLVVACTDISVVVRESEPVDDVPILDANTSLAHAIIRAAAAREPGALAATDVHTG